MGIHDRYGLLTPSSAPDFSKGPERPGSPSPAGGRPASPSRRPAPEAPPDVGELEIAGDIAGIAKLAGHASTRLAGEACEALSRMAAARDDRKAAAVRGGALPVLLKQLSNPNDGVKAASAAALGAIASGNVILKEDVVSVPGLVQMLVKLLVHSEVEIVRCCAVALGHLADTTDDDIRGVLFKARTVPGLEKLNNHADGSVRAAAAAALRQCAPHAPLQAG